MITLHRPLAFVSGSRTNKDKGDFDEREEDGV
jgi:hypothetical protein